MTMIPNAHEYLNALNEMVFIVTPEMAITFANQATCDFCGLTLEEMENYSIWELPLWAYSETFQNDLMFKINLVYTTEEPLRIEAKARNSQEEFSEIDLRIQTLVKDGNVTGLMLTAFNITELIKAKGFLTKRDRQINAFFKNSTEGYFFLTLPETAILPDPLSSEAINRIYEAQRLESVSQKVLTYIGLPDSTDTTTLNLLDALNIDNSERSTIWHEMLTKGLATIEKELINRQTNKKVILELKFVGIFIDKTHFDGNFCIVSNITQRYIYERELSFLANKDPLTGLNNRRNFYRLSNRMFLAEHDCHSVIMFDIDRFKTINDTHGHDVGDIAIRKVADIIDGIVGDNGVVGRYGGEEFIALLPMASLGAYDIAEDIRKTIETTSINFGAGTLKMTVSAGIHEFHSRNEEDFHLAITFADKALLEAKKTGRNRTILYDDELHGHRAIDKLTGTYNKNALIYKSQLFHDALRKSDITYGIIVIRLDTQIVHQLEILSQYIKQTAAMLHSMLRDHDVIGRCDNMTFVVLISNVNVHVVRNISKRIHTAVFKLSDKFDHLVTSQVSEVFVDDWSVKVEDLYDDAFNRLDCFKDKQ